MNMKHVEYQFINWISRWYQFHKVNGVTRKDVIVQSSTIFLNFELMNMFTTN